MRKRKTLLVLVCFMIIIIFTGCLDKMPRIRVKAENLDLTEEDFNELSKEAKLLDGDMKEDFVRLTFDVYIENIKRDDNNKVKVLNLNKFNTEEKTRIIYMKEIENNDSDPNHLFSGKYYLDLRGLSREEIVKLYKELELSVNYVVNGNLSEEIYKFDDNFNLNSQ